MNLHQITRVSSPPDKYPQSTFSEILANYLLAAAALHLLAALPPTFADLFLLLAASALRPTASQIQQRPHSPSMTAGVHEMAKIRHTLLRESGRLQYTFTCLQWSSPLSLAKLSARRRLFRASGCWAP